ncbi:hypothetical protein BXT86_06460 [candidate division WOR-3 bacterium 4484_100]|uniref:Methylenetetrahydrofolate reductase n=1 Tax=candidate division WOR-3 bacterium 4484_100 TaxID=1936077 RepID=A0A1V4QDL1_UNCW3|nr:MAG: hypothetical protein BXT86_06460 [candidate division WOR-3 bacterium 4484_100]
MLRDKLARSKIITLEILLPISCRVKDLLEQLARFKAYVDAFNIPSNPLGKLRPDALCYGHIIQENLGIETIPHFVARHFTSLSFESHLLGASALGIENILCVTGDTPAEGRSSFELNSQKLLEIARNLSAGITSSRKAIPPVDFCLCTSFNPNVVNVRGEFIKSKGKLECGAEVFFTQPIFDTEKFLRIISEFRRAHSKAKVIAGLSFLYSKKRAFKLMKFLGIPYKYIIELDKRDELAILYETAERVEKFVDGFYIIPIGRYEPALNLIKKIKELIH